MARKATRNMYGFETVGGVEVRRLVAAGSLVPPHYRLEDESAVQEVNDRSMVVGPTASEQAADDTSYESMTVAELRAEIDRLGLDTPSGAVKADLIDVLEANDVS